MAITSEQTRTAQALLRSSQAGTEFIPDGVRHRRASMLDARSMFEDLRAISLRSAARLHGHEPLADADLYNENGLPA